MNFPRYWSKKESAGQIAWGWSHQSQQEAETLAREAAAKKAERIARRDFPQRHNGYYPGRPLREPVITELKRSDGEIAGIVTRNSYGCRVLNTARAMFVDVDLKEASKPGLLGRLFGKAPEPVPDTDARETVTIQKAEQWARDHSDWGWRIYRTRAGLRLLATHAQFEPQTEFAAEVFDWLDADPLYRQLCKTQKCFRARLTPKPWRCGVSSRPESWPFFEASAEKRFEKWQAGYTAASQNWATCKLIHICGNHAVHPDLEPLITLHDQETRAESGLPLA